MSDCRIERCVEALCSRGCRRVWSVIEALEAGRKPPEVRHLTAAEVRAVLDELKSVMAVYEGVCVAG